MSDIQFRMPLKGRVAGFVAASDKFCPNDSFLFHRCIIIIIYHYYNLCYSQWSEKSRMTSVPVCECAGTGDNNQEGNVSSQVALASLHLTNGWEGDLRFLFPSGPCTHTHLQPSCNGKKISAPIAVRLLESDLFYSGSCCQMTARGDLQQMWDK